MKILIYLPLALLMFSGCIAPDRNDTTVQELKSQMRMDTSATGKPVYNMLDWETTLVDTTGDYHVKGFNEKGQGAYLVVKDTTWKTQKVISRSTFLLTMSRKMVKHFMSASDYFTEAFLWALIMSIMAAAGIYIFLRNDLMRYMGKGGALGVILIVLIAVPFRMFQKRPSELAMNNVKQLSRAELEAWKAKDPTFETFWKEKWERNELVGLTNKAVVK